MQDSPQHYLTCSFQNCQSQGKTKERVQTEGDERDVATE